jgi:N6-adenosine-specific RNA methylase IME4
LKRTPQGQTGLFRTWKTIVADFAWPYDDEGIRGGVAHHYETLTIEQGLAMPVSTYAWDNAHLYLWITNAHLLEGVGAQMCRAWGFRPITVITWHKPMIGTGHYFRNTTEHIIFAVRGALPLKLRNLRTDYRWPRGKHSEKPAESYALIEKASPGEYLELFARRQRGDGWSCWGNECPDSVELPALDRVFAWTKTGEAA